jgi:hypothetical protein
VKRLPPLLWSMVAWENRLPPCSRRYLYLRPSDSAKENQPAAAPGQLSGLASASRIGKLRGRKRGSGPRRKRNPR